MSDFVTLEEDDWIKEQKELRRSLIHERRSIATSLDSLGYHSDAQSSHAPRETLGNDSLWSYLISLPYNITAVNSVRGKQARLTTWEALEFFDMCNDFVFLSKVAFTIHQIKVTADEDEVRKLPYGYVALVMLTCIYIISLVAYATRRWWLYHRISDTDYQFFVPVLSLYKIRQAGMSPATVTSLFMFERLVWTYQLTMRLLEDVPQVVVSTVYMANFGKDPYIYFMIAYSLIMIVITSYRMGSEFPLMRTLTLLFSKSPPVDSPILAEAAPLRRHFALLIAFNCFIWSLTHYLCGNILPHKIWRGLERIFAGFFLSIGTLALCQWSYLMLHAEKTDSENDTDIIESSVEMQQRPSSSLIAR